ncbi:MAG: PDGLE domain-containing protein [Candidatus Margulisbacteria bacterium]|nr:PDGLE domain-containing protein [Candidatus Margulisiibacteriota bacterium]MBU1616613.1 PDGLE domain-containing protein [Candidatus Margulisiibacteriota bacterium]MBU1867454.1 PDGLE domain-containing protein [Candidatus Margulisiibacteriota bacterium]
MRNLFLLSIAIVVLASFFASTHPDGLDYVAGSYNFANKGVERTALLNYSTAGIVGVVIILALFWGSVRLFKSNKGAVK